MSILEEDVPAADQVIHPHKGEDHQREGHHRQPDHPPAPQTGAEPQSQNDRMSKDRFSVTIITESTWAPLAKFIYALQKSPKMIQIDRSSLDATEKEESLLKGQFLIRLSAVP